MKENVCFRRAFTIVSSFQSNYLHIKQQLHVPFVVIKDAYQEKLISKKFKKRKHIWLKSINSNAEINEKLYP